MLNEAWADLGELKCGGLISVGAPGDGRVQVQTEGAGALSGVGVRCGGVGGVCD